MLVNPRDIMDKYHKESEELAAKYQFNDDRAGFNYEVDAFRHAYSSAVMTYDYNRFAARVGGDAHEFLGLVSNIFKDSKSKTPYSETNMDYWNNYIGREIGANAKSREEIAQKIADALNQGKLITDKTGTIDKRTYPYDLPDWIPYSDDYRKQSSPRFTPNDWHDNGYQCLAPWAKETNKYRNNKYFVTDPLTLDLNGDGIKTIAAAGFSGSLFDHNNDGIRTATGWVNKEDGLLVRDVNGNGIIDNGSELFGDNTALADGSKAAHGFVALAQLDSNNDGKVDALDNAFNELKVWIDANSDGISQASELRTLMDLDIQSLDVAYKDVNQNLGNGNFIRQLGSYTKTDGSTAQMGDAWFASDKLYSRFTDKIDMTAEQAGAANLSGIGRLRDGSRECIV